MASVTTYVEPYRPGAAEVSWATRAWYGVESARIFLVDILPILLRHWTRQQVRNTVDRLTFLTATEREHIKQWLRSRGF